MNTDWQVLKKPLAPWHIPRRWRVRRVRHRLTDMWGNWAVYPSWEPRPFSNEDADTHFFATHAEALSYADKQARTVEATLPRATYGDKVVADKGLYSVHVHHRPHVTDITLGGWEGLTVENKDLWDLALYLAACAQHWKEEQQ